MTISEKIKLLQDNHLSEWMRIRLITRDELSLRQPMWCVCGKLASGLHENNCKKFNDMVNSNTVKKLNHLIKELIVEPKK